MAIIYGVPASPYVRKTMLAHTFKGIDFDLVPTRPGSDDISFREASPLGKIPGYRINDDVAFSDSSVIIAYLERSKVGISLYPSNAEDFAQALWLEEYSDTVFSEVVSGLYFQRIIGPTFFEHTPDEERIEALVSELIPARLDYLEDKLAGNAFFIGNQFSVADLSLGSHILSLHHTNFNIDKSRWPALAAFAESFLKKPEVITQLAQENAMLGK